MVYLYFFLQYYNSLYQLWFNENMKVLKTVHITTIKKRHKQNEKIKNKNNKSNEIMK